MDFSIGFGGLSLRVSGHSVRHRSPLLLANSLAAFHNHFQTVKQNAERMPVIYCRQPVRIGFALDALDALDILVPNLHPRHLRRLLNTTLR